MTDALSSIIGLYKHGNVEKSHPIAVMSRELLRAQETGRPLSPVFRRYLPKTEATIVSAGAERQTLVVALRAAAYFANNSSEVVKLLITLAYPAVLVSCALGLVALVGAETLPGYKQMMPFDKWPENAKIYHNFAMTLVNFWWAVAAGMAATVAAVWWSITSWSSDFRDKLSSIPPYSVYRKYATSSMFMALSCIMQSNLPLRSAVLEIKSGSTGLLRKHSSRILGSLDKGAEPADAFKTGVPVGAYGLTRGYIDPGAWYRMVSYIKRDSFTEVVDKVAKRVAVDATGTIKKAVAVAFFLGLITTSGLIMWTFVSQKYLEGATTSYLKRPG